jgi:hypothetical protein
MNASAATQIGSHTSEREKHTGRERSLPSKWLQKGQWQQSAKPRAEQQ